MKDNSFELRKQKLAKREDEGLDKGFMEKFNDIVG